MITDRTGKHLKQLEMCWISVVEQHATNRKLLNLQSKRKSKKTKVLLENHGQTWTERGRFLGDYAQLMLMVWRAASCAASGELVVLHAQVSADRLDEQLGEGRGGDRASQVLPGKDSGRRCAAVEGTRWKSR